MSAGSTPRQRPTDAILPKLTGPAWRGSGVCRLLPVAGGVASYGISDPRRARKVAPLSTGPILFKMTRHKGAMEYLFLFGIRGLAIWRKIVFYDALCTNQSFDRDELCLGFTLCPFRTIFLSAL
jgi:hypothetical protein